MTEEELDIAIAEIMKEIRKSPDYLGQSCNADAQCSQENHSSLENPNGLKKGTCCGEKLHIEQNHTIKEKKKIKDVVELSNENNNKLKVDIYVPLDACACEWDKFMNRIFMVLTPYIKYINHETKNINSDEGERLNIHGNCVVIDGEKKIPSSVLLKRELPKLLKAKGLI